MNLAQIKFFGLFISALCKVQTVGFEKLTGSFNSDVKMDSSLRRLLMPWIQNLLSASIVWRKKQD